MTAVAEEIPEADAIVKKPLSAIPVLVVLALMAVLVVRCGSGSDSPRPTAAAEAAANGTSVGQPQADTPVPANSVPLRPPPSDACVTKSWCGKKLGYASIIVDAGYRKSGLPRRAWVIAVATAMQESSLQNEASDKYKETLQFPYDKVGDDHDSVGLFQQRPSQGWGSPAELMNPRTAAEKFYGALKDKIKNRPNWEKERLTDIAQAVQRSAYPEAYQKHEAAAVQIVDFVLGFTYTKESFKDTAKSNWFVMFQCAKPSSYACQETPWQLVKPVTDNRDAFKKHYPTTNPDEIGDLGDVPHENAASPEDHTPGGASCLNGVCNAWGWIYAQDFGPSGGLDMNRFIHWLLDIKRAYPDLYPELKYVISTLPQNKGTAYYGIMKAKNGWRAESHDPDHDRHIHLSYAPGFERAGSTILEDYYRSTQA